MKVQKRILVFGRILLVASVFVNATLLIINLHLGELESRLTELRGDEYYFILNKQTTSSEFNKIVILGAIANQMIMLRRLSAQHLSDADDMTIREDILTTQKSVEKSLRDITAMNFHMSNKLDSSIDPFELMRDIDKDSLSVLNALYAEQAFEVVVELKKNMKDVSEQVTRWRANQSVLLVLNMLLLVLGSTFLFWESISNKS